MGQGGADQEHTTPPVGNGKYLLPGSKTNTHLIISINYLALDDAPGGSSLQTGGSMPSPCGHTEGQVQLILPLTD